MYHFSYSIGIYKILWNCRGNANVLLNKGFRFRYKVKKKNNYSVSATVFSNDVWFKNKNTFNWIFQELNLPKSKWDIGEKIDRKWKKEKKENPIITEFSLFSCKIRRHGMRWTFFVSLFPVSRNIWYLQISKECNYFVTRNKKDVGCRKIEVR